MPQSAFIAIVGRPSAGKSTLINTLCGHKVSIVSPVPQTTRNAIRGIRNDPRGQLVFVDTPGFHLSEKSFNKRLSDLVSSNVGDTDIILYVLDASRPVGPEEEAIAKLLSTSDKPIIIALNKLDLGSPEEEHRSLLERTFGAVGANASEGRGLHGIYSISALHKNGIKDLVDAMLALAPEGPLWYPPEIYTDQDPGFRICEIIREQVTQRTRDELPHACYVDIEHQALLLSNGETAPPDFDSSQVWDTPVSQRPVLQVSAVIFVERESQKGIVVGKGGSLIRDIRLASLKELYEILPWRIEMDLRVKVNPKWRSDSNLLKRLIT